MSTNRVESSPVSPDSLNAQVDQKDAGLKVAREKFEGMIKDLLPGNVIGVWADESNDALSSPTDTAVLFYPSHSPKLNALLAQGDKYSPIHQNQLAIKEYRLNGKWDETGFVNGQEIYSGSENPENDQSAFTIFGKPVTKEEFDEFVAFVKAKMPTMYQAA